MEKVRSKHTYAALPSSIIIKEKIMSLQDFQENLEVKISVLFYQEAFESERGEEHLAWVAQGLEYDIAAQGRTIQEAKHRFGLTVITQILMDTRKQKSPLEGISAAPNHYLELARTAHLLEEKGHILSNPSPELPPDFPLTTIKTQQVYA